MVVSSLVQVSTFTLISAISWLLTSKTRVISWTFPKSQTIPSTHSPGLLYPGVEEAVTVWVAWGRERQWREEAGPLVTYLPSSGLGREEPRVGSKQLFCTQNQWSQGGWQPGPPTNTRQPRAPSPIPSQLKLLAGAAVRFPMQPWHGAVAKTLVWQFSLFKLKCDVGRQWAVVARCQREHVLEILVPRCSNLGLPHPQTAPEPASHGGQSLPLMGSSHREQGMMRNRLRETRERGKRE